jgi:hypothetical protein
MKRVSKYAAAAVVTGALALAAATPSQARWYGHHGYYHGHYHAGPAAAIGFGVGALFGAAAASSYYDNGYYDYGYAYAPDAGYAYAAPRYDYFDNPYANPHEGPGCIQSPGSINFTGCDR